MKENTQQKVAGQTRSDTVFKAILTKNIIARSGNVNLDYLESIERALALAASLLGKRDNQPSAKAVYNQNVI